MDGWKITIHKDDAERVSKYVFEKPNAVAEAVLYRYPTFKDRTVICCSTQSGCPVGCRFCGAGDYFVRSLTTDEIVSQPVRLLEDVDCDPNDMGRLQIMFMSMGEPLLNLRNLAPAMRQLHAMYPKAALLISSIGPRISATQMVELFDVSKEITTIGLQFSVHESTDEARNRLIPFDKKLGLDEIADVGRAWSETTGRRPFFNYCAHDANSSPADADRLMKQFPPNVWNATVSVVCERNEGLPATNEHQRELAVRFGNLLLARGFDVRVFDPAGQDTIGGGCGQLWFVQRWLSEHGEASRPSCGHGRPVVHAPVGAT